MFIIEHTNYFLGVSTEVVEQAILTPTHYAIVDGFVQGTDPNFGAVFIGVPSLAEHCTFQFLNLGFMLAIVH